MSEAASREDRLLTFEVGGWECHPGFARDMAAVRGAIRMQCRVPVWAEEASIRLASKRWPQLLPVAMQVLSELGWWADAGGQFIFRRDSYGQQRAFELGVDAPEVVLEWLRDVYRRRGLAHCGRVVQSLRRGAEDRDWICRALRPALWLCLLDTGGRGVLRRAPRSITLLWLAQGCEARAASSGRGPSRLLVWWPHSFQAAFVVELQVHGGFDPLRGWVHEPLGGEAVGAASSADSQASGGTGC